MVELKEVQQDLFKGFIRTKNKKAIDKFKNVSAEELHSFKEIQSLPEFAGILSQNIVLIDIDNEEESEILFNLVREKQLKTIVFKTTRGMHFYFYNENNIPTNKIKTKLFLGIEADIKIGKRNSYSILKFNDIEREILYSNGLYTVPKYLLPSTRKLNFSEMEEGDGRNQELFNYILHLQSNEFSIEEAKECIYLINDFVLKSSLSKDEIDTVLRDDSFKKPIFYKGSQFLFDKFAKYIVSKYNIKRLNNRLHIYKDGVYVDGYMNIEREMIKEISTLNKSKRNEILSYMDLLVENETFTNSTYIAFRNGIYDIKTKTLKDFNPEIITRNKINWDYNPNSYDELMDKTLDKLSNYDKNIRSIIEEMIGYCFFPRNELGMAFMLTGGKQNGKSTLLGTLQYLLGTENISSLDIKDLGDRFKTAELFGKLANIGDDIGEDFIPDTSTFKKLATGDRMVVERKGQDPFEFNNYSKLIFSANRIPRMKDKTGAVQRRLVIVPFEMTFSSSDKDFDPFIKYKLREQKSMEYLIQLGLKGLERVLTNHKFTKSEKVEKELKEYQEMNNPILLFFKETQKDEIVNEPVNDVYRKYNIFCSENNLQPLSKVEFGRITTQHYEVESKPKKIQGKNVRIYVKSQ